MAFRAKAAISYLLFECIDAILQAWTKRGADKQGIPE